MIMGESTVAETGIHHQGRTYHQQGIALTQLLVYVADDLFIDRTAIKTTLGLIKPEQWAQLGSCIFSRAAPGFCITIGPPLTVR